ncbi:diguanylate cyclase/phosphodiesterase [Magnetococcus marinus MC-1]|uniref:Diguanylate cyclase/phosphodiesterase n=1 Tax=Magnetococcus marinus (strain ATCC BAA-1437 / JCM 17883 / MC-1) TaxID=156889 RepID=A0L6C9_MAGMM|nr:EAL domain-containing protein [Magnetococcus marinus]ABK43522.1 diguanylate cyclase/phosphodiesterase [Magnetococcus marinus MC-1]
MDFSFDGQHLLHHLADGIIIHEQDMILYANEIARIMLGTEIHTDLTQSLFSLRIDPTCREAWLHNGANHSHEADRVKLVDLKLLPEAKPFTHVEALTIPFQGNERLLVTTLRDISEKKRQEERIRHQANYDALTGLPNRGLFLDRLKLELARAKRTDVRVAVMFIDLDRFKWVNDTLGHAAGDDLLREASKRLLSCHRQSDTVARMGGDEFTVILPDMARGPHAERVAAQILEQLAAPFTLEGQEVTISGSVGVTIFPDDADNLDDLLKNADTAMYRAKSQGRNAYRFYTPDMHAEAMARMALERELSSAVEDQELALCYQPIVDLNTNRIAGAEALLRWNHPTLGAVSPEVFIPIAEEMGLIAQITEWAVREACTQACQWRSQYGTAKDFFISVNLTCTRCRELSTDDKIPSILAETQLPPHALVLEVTETILGEDPPKAMAMLNHLKQIGVRLWLDDFGTGSSSLSVLRNLPVCGVKIDRTFVPDALNDKEAEVLVTTIINMGRSLNRILIGEGVETEAQRLYLEGKGVQLAQGYFFGKPCSAAEFPDQFFDH